MSIIRELPTIIDEAIERNSRIEGKGFRMSESWQTGPREPEQPELDLTGERLPGAEEDTGSGNTHRLYHGDNLRLMDHLLRNGMGGSIQMIYIDPPFFTRSEFDAVVEVGKRRIHHPAYEDTWTSGLREYLIRLTRSLLMMRELLAEDGLLWLHLDWHASHYARVLLDEIFGAECFVNEIIWEYKSGGSTRKRFARKHDNILVYSKSRRYKFHPLKEKSYNRGLKPYRFKGVEEFRDEAGWYTMVNMKDVWQMDMVGRTSGERTGYATQKPEKLLQRIVECCTDPGDLVADFFCGSGTMGAVAARLARRSLQCDRESLAVERSLERIVTEGAGACIFEENGDREHREHARVFEAVFESGEDQGLRTVSLTGVRDFRHPEGMDSKSERLLAEALAEEPLNAVAGWSVDPAYDGEVFRPAVAIRRNKKGLAAGCEIEAVPGNIMVKVIDVMGRAEWIRL